MRPGSRVPAMVMALQQPLVGLSKGSAYNRWLETKAAALGVKLTFSTCVSNFQAMCQLVNVGLGLGIAGGKL